MLPFLEKFGKVLDASPLSDSSKQAYKHRLRRLTDITGKDVDWILDHCKETMDKLKTKAKLSEPQTLKSLINAVLVLFKYTLGLKDKKKKSYTCWYNAFDEVNKVAKARYDNLEATERQLASHVSWSDILQTRDSLNLNSVEYFILSLYTMIPPARADMNKVKIYTKEPTSKDVELVPNYLVIHNNGMKLVYNEFKSKGRRMLQYEKDLPSNLEEVIKKSLARNPRDYLIVSTRTGKPYDNAHSYTVYVDRVFSRIFKKNVTINSLRHSFINSLDFQRLTPAEKEIIAKDMMHSVSTMERYRWKLSGKESTTGKPQVCEVICRDA